jgi:L-seryl-tRNA(Ser) seleniumtransferase
MSDNRRAIPSVEKLLSTPEMQPILAREPRTRVVNVLRAIQEAVRRNGTHTHDVAWYVTEANRRLQLMQTSSLRRVINATGVVLHTNLGRAPLSDAALSAIVDAARDYSNLEYDLEAGTRGSRYDHCKNLLGELTGAESALVVNNNAAALVLALNTFAEGKAAVVSRGELVEIGGSFRIPDIMRRSGARLHEVGATNRTHLRDYAEAVTADTGALLKVHRSNFQMSGYVSEVEARELQDVAGESAVVIHDLGSGLLEDLGDVGLSGEPTARIAVAALPDGIITLSGDKLLGGPQSGILLGKRNHIDRMKQNPLCRALRVDKLTIAALEATLRAYANGRARTEIPVLRMLTIDADVLEQRAARFRDALIERDVSASVLAATSVVGGGAFPDARLPTEVVVLESSIPATELEARLRAQQLPVITRIIDNQVAIDLRTVNEADEPSLLDAVVNVARD